ncbi:MULTISPECIES: SRPBCC family protein [Streptomyces]|uniref:SRPBCC family protein n=1 Tax=Streptomyces TaxID=1883 RepID=UPI0007CD8817|nr:hypothetical protein A4V12_01150 [Streptomyces noursei]
MSAIRQSVEISRRPEDVFTYMTDTSHLPEWQESALSVSPVGRVSGGLGSRVRVTRQVGHRRMPMTMEMSEYDPPRSFRMDGIDGPVRGHVRGTVEPIGDGERSRVTLDLNFESHGIGKVLVPLVVRTRARKEMPKNEQHLKDILEARP